MIRRGSGSYWRHKVGHTEYSIPIMDNNIVFDEYFNFTNKSNFTVHWIRYFIELVVHQNLSVFSCLNLFVFLLFRMHWKLFRLISLLYMLDNLINRAVFRIFKCSSMSEIWFIRSVFDLEAIGVMLEGRQSNFISKFRCSVLYSDAILRCI